MKIYMDEAGRGPLYGPLHIGLVSSNIPETQLKKHKLFKDSKALTPKKREIAFNEIQKLKEEKKVLCEIGTISSEFIDTYGITRAINTAIIKSLYVMLSNILNTKIKKKIKKTDIIKIIEDYNNKTKDGIEMIIDGKTDFGIGKEYPIKTKTIIHGDAENIQISMASILAKVSRDKILDTISLKYPEYHFDKHKGYGTKLHYESIEKYGLLPEHRKLFLKKIFPERKIQKYDDKISFSIS